VFVVHASHEATSFRQLLDIMRKSPEGTQYVSPSIGSVGNMVAEYLGAREKLKLLHVTYRGGGAAILDLVAGHVKVGSMTLSTTRQHIQEGKLRALAVSSAQRVKDFPDLPTLTELGYPELVVTTWYGLSGPANLPRDIVEKLNREVNAAMREPEVQKYLEQEMVQTKAMSPDEFTRFMQAEVNQWVPEVKKVIGTK